MRLDGASIQVDRFRSRFGVASLSVSSRFASWDERHRRRRADVGVGLADDGDLSALVEIAEAHSGVAGGWTERLGADLLDDGRALFAAQVNATLAGYGRVRHFAPSERSPAGTAPPGWYLAGVVVAPQWRGYGAGEALTQARLAWVAERADEVWYYANARNAVSLALHGAVGFEEVTREFSVPGVSFEGGVGVLCRLRLGPEHRRLDGQASARR